jgi:predicted lactoylglutathione lyase
MIGYTTVGTNNFERSAEFYDGLFFSMGIKRAMQTDDFIAWGNEDGTPMFSIHLPENNQPATVGNGVMIALSVNSPEQVDAVYNQAIALGSVNEGKPGPRGDSGFFAAYFRDLDGNKLNVHCMS